MPKQTILILIILMLASWFLLVERQNFREKIFIITGIAVIYATFRVLTGASFDQIFTPIVTYFNS